MLDNASQLVGECPICDEPVEICWTVNEEALPDGETHLSGGSTWVVTKCCKHLTVTGGGYDGLVDPMPSNWFSR